MIGPASIYILYVMKLKRNVKRSCDKNACDKNAQYKFLTISIIGFNNKHFEYFPYYLVLINCFLI